MTKNRENNITSVTKDEVLMNIEEASKYLGISRNSLYAKTCKNQIPFYKLGKRILFDKHELYCWITQNFRVKPDFEIEQEVRQQILNKTITNRSGGNHEKQ